MLPAAPLPSPSGIQITSPAVAQGAEEAVAFEGTVKAATGPAAVSAAAAAVAVAMTVASLVLIRRLRVRPGPAGNKGLGKGDSRNGRDCTVEAWVSASRRVVIRKRARRPDSPVSTHIAQAKDGHERKIDLGHRPRLHLTDATQQSAAGEEAR
jgi:hypothetical protein